MRRRGDPDSWQRGEEERSMDPWPGGQPVSGQQKGGRGWNLAGITHRLWFCSEQIVGVVAASPAPTKPQTHTPKPRCCIGLQRTSWLDENWEEGTSETEGMIKRAREWSLKWSKDAGNRCSCATLEWNSFLWGLGLAGGETIPNTHFMMNTDFRELLNDFSLPCSPGPLAGAPPQMKWWWV